MESIRKHKWTVLGIVAYALFMDYFIYGLVVPLSPYSPAKITSESQMGMLYAAYALGVLLATPVFGHLGDKLGCRRPMIIGVILSGIATLLFCFANSFPLALAARLSQGAAAAGTWTAGLALVAGNYSDKRVQMMGLALVGSTAGSVLGPVAGGWLYELGGYQFPFLITGAMVLLDALMRTCLLPADSKPAESAHAENDYLIPLLTDRSVLVAGLAVALAAAGFGIVEPILPNHLRQAGIAPAQVGVLFTCSTIVYGLSAPLVEWVSEKFSIKNTIVFGIVAMSVVLPLLALSSDYIVTALCLAAVNVSYAFMLNPSSAELGNAVDRRGLNCYAAVYAIYNITYSLGMIGVDAFASAASEKLSLLQIFCSMSLVLLFSIPFVIKALGSSSQVITKGTIGDSGVQEESASG
jgi:DHA1 family solute carrier family 18 vesicular amine transporter 1/2